MKKKKRVKAKTAPKVKHTKKLSLFVVVPLIMVSLFVLAATTYKIVEIVLINNSSSNFPKLEISLAEAPIEQIDSNSKDVKYANNTITITINGNSSTYEDVEIKGRGNSTWIQPKKPYQIKLPEKESIFGFGEDKKWVLLANYLDSTHLRTDIAYHLESILGTKYPLSGHHIELYTDGIYKGLYFLSEKIEIGKNRINLQDPYGIIMELDNLRGNPNECFYSKNGECFILQDSTNPDNKTVTTNNFIDTFNKIELAIEQKDTKSIESLMDIDSFAIYFILNEFLVNPDAYSSSFFVYKDGLNEKIYAGPGWDFDLSLSNNKWYIEEKEFENFHSPFTDTALKNYAIASKKNSSDGSNHHISTLLYDLLDIPSFKNRVKEIYQETLSGKGEDLLDYIKSQADYIRTAALKDQERWKLETEFDEEVDYLIDWVAKRYDHFEQTYGINSN